MSQSLGLEVDEATSRRLAKIRQRDTAAERLLRDLLRTLGIRYGRSRRRLPGSPDIINLQRKWVLFVHGCFWHAHQGCVRATVPRRNRSFWSAKFETNRARDRRVIRQLRGMGFKVLVVWECDLEQRPARVLSQLRRQLGRDS
jgi:DNA mismatch endonuclease (patch repair protein)